MNLSRIKIMPNNKLSAFTLAEVLITLGIIGIVAALTIPTLINNYQKQSYATALKKGYLQYQGFLKQYMADEGTTNLNDTDLYDQPLAETDANRQKQVEQIIRKYFKVAKFCKPLDTDCIYPMKFLKATGTDLLFSQAGRYNIFTIDGMAYSFDFDKAQCKPNLSYWSKIKSSCGFVYIDVNGPKPPNKNGYDVHAGFVVNYDGFIFPIYGREYSNYIKAVVGNDSNPDIAHWTTVTNSCGQVGQKEADMSDITQGQCVARIMENGWTIDY